MGNQAAALAAQPVRPPVNHIKSIQVKHNPRGPLKSLADDDHCYLLIETEQNETMMMTGSGSNFKLLPTDRQQHSLHQNIGEQWRPYTTLDELKLKAEKSVNRSQLSDKCTCCNLSNIIHEEMPRVAPKDAFVEVLEVREQICESPPLKLLGANHCYLLAYCQGGSIVRLERGGSNEHFKNTLVNADQVTGNMIGRVRVDRPTIVGDLEQACAKHIGRPYKLILHNCFWFVGEVVEEVGAPKELVEQVFKMNEMSVQDVTGRLFRFIHQSRYRALQEIGNVGGNDEVMEQNGQRQVEAEGNNNGGQNNNNQDQHHQNNGGNDPPPNQQNLRVEPQAQPPLGNPNPMAPPHSPQITVPEALQTVTTVVVEKDIVMSSINKIYSMYMRYFVDVRFLFEQSYRKTGNDGRVNKKLQNGDPLIVEFNNGIYGSTRKADAANQTIPVQEPIRTSQNPTSTSPQPPTSQSIQQSQASNVEHHSQQYYGMPTKERAAPTIEAEPTNSRAASWRVPLPLILQLIQGLILVISKRFIKVADLLACVVCAFIGWSVLLLTPVIWDTAFVRWILHGYLQINSREKNTQSALLFLSTYLGVIVVSKSPLLVKNLFRKWLTNQGVKLFGEQSWDIEQFWFWRKLCEIGTLILKWKWVATGVLIASALLYWTSLIFSPWELLKILAGKFWKIVVAIWHFIIFTYRRKTILHLAIASIKNLKRIWVVALKLLKCFESWLGNPVVIVEVVPTPAPAPGLIEREEFPQQWTYETDNPQILSQSNSILEKYKALTLEEKDSQSEREQPIILVAVQERDQKQHEMMQRQERIREEAERKRLREVVTVQLVDLLEEQEDNEQLAESIGEIFRKFRV